MPEFTAASALDASALYRQEEAANADYVAGLTERATYQAAIHRIHTDLALVTGGRRCVCPACREARSTD